MAKLPAVKLPLTIEIVNPAVDRGRPPREIRQSDIIRVPVTYQRGTWSLLDLISPESALAAVTVYKRVGGKI